MPKRGFADFMSAFIRIVAVIYFIVQLGIFVFSFLATRQFQFGGLASALLFTAMAFGLGILLDVALSIERILYGHRD